MPAEWQSRQLLLTAAEPGPWNIRSPEWQIDVHRCQLQFVVGVSASWHKRSDGEKGERQRLAQHVNSPQDTTTEVCSTTLRMNPLGLRGGLRFGACAGASDHQHLRSPGRRGKADLPLNSMSPSEASIMCAASLRALATILSLTMVRVPPLIVVEREPPMPTPQ